MWPSQRWNKLHAPGTGASRNANASGRWWSQMVAVLSNYSQCQCPRKLLVWNDGTKPTRQARNHAGHLWLAVGMFNDFKRTFCIILSNLVQRLVHILSDFSLRAVFCFWLWVFDAPAIQLWKCTAGALISPLFEGLGPTREELAAGDGQDGQDGRGF